MNSGRWSKRYTLMGGSIDAFGWLVITLRLTIIIVLQRCIIYKNSVRLKEFWWNDERCTGKWSWSFQNSSGGRGGGG